MALNNNAESGLNEYEKVVRQIKGVISARFVTDDKGEIIEIHVLSGSGRYPKQIVRDIESALIAQFGLKVDHKKISVAQMHDEEAPALGAELRLKVHGVTVLLSGRTIESKVQLEIGGEIYQGTAKGPNTSSNKYRLVSQATVAALEDYLKGTCNIVTEDIKPFTLAGTPAVAAAVSLVTNIGEERLIGAVIVKNDEKEAAVKATLAAVNRRLALLLGD